MRDFSDLNAGQPPKLLKAIDSSDKWDKQTANARFSEMSTLIVSAGCC